MPIFLLSSYPALDIWISTLDYPVMRFFLTAILFLMFSGAISRAQHDAQRNSVRHIAAGRFGAIEKEYEKPKVDAGKSETLFVEMLVDLAQGRPEAALEKARASVEAGLPFERLLAGPRELLDKLHTAPGFSEWRTEVNPSRVIHGPMIGSVTDTGASIWLRLDGETENVSAKGSIVNMSRVVESTVADAVAENGFTVVLKMENLSPGMPYQGDIYIDGELIDGKSFRFETYPKPGTPSKFSVAFGGGAGFVPEWERMWDTIGNHKPSAFLMLGDNVYIDDPENPLTHHYCYSRRQSRLEWQKLISTTPVYSIYDDHDFGINDCVPGPEIESPAWKRQVWNLFRQNWVNPAYGGGEGNPGCWYDFSIGDVQFFMLDGRYYRDLEGGSMLGPVQKKWLLEALSKSKATFKVIASPVPFTPDIKPGSRDPWDGYPEEREEIFSHIESEKIDGVFLVAADRHRTDLRKIARNNGPDFYEFESSRLTNHHTHSVVKTKGLLWGYSEKCSFGLMEFDTAAEVPQVTFKCIDIDDQEHHSYVLKQSDTER